MTELKMFTVNRSPSWKEDVDKYIELGTRYTPLSEADVAEQGLPETEADEMYLRDKENFIYLAAFVTPKHRMDVDTMEVALVIFDTDLKWKKDKGTVEIEYCHMVDGVGQKYRGTPMIQGETYFFTVFTRDVTGRVQHLRDELLYSDALQCANRVNREGKYKIVDNAKRWMQP